MNSTKIKRSMIVELAEEMGWRRSIREAGQFDNDDHPSLFVWLDPQGNAASIADLPFDPLNDANDDFAVMEWMTSDANYDRPWVQGRFASLAGSCLDYRVGDYAKAAIIALGMI